MPVPGPLELIMLIPALLWLFIPVALLYLGWRIWRRLAVIEEKLDYLLEEEELIEPQDEE